MISEIEEITEPTYKITLELTETELNLLLGLADFPTWGAQPKEIRDFLQELTDIGSSLSVHGKPAFQVGYVPEVSFDKD